MKEKYEPLDMKLELFENVDVIVTSDQVPEQQI